MRAKFDVLEIAPNEYEGIWSLIDDGAGEVKIDRFVDLLHNLRGDAKAKDTFSIMRKVHMANKVVAAPRATGPCATVGYAGLRKIASGILQKVTPHQSTEPHRGVCASIRL